MSTQQGDEVVVEPSEAIVVDGELLVEPEDTTADASSKANSAARGAENVRGQPSAVNKAKKSANKNPGSKASKRMSLSMALALGLIILGILAYIFWAEILLVWYSVFGYPTTGLTSATHLMPLPDGEENDLVWILIGILFSCLSGVLYHLASGTSYQAVLPHSDWVPMGKRLDRQFVVEVGLFGHIIAGVVGGFTLLGTFETLIPLQLAEGTGVLDPWRDYMYVIVMTSVGGYLGVQLLQGLAKRLGENLSNKDVVERMDVQEREYQARIDALQAEFMSQEYLNVEQFGSAEEEINKALEKETSSRRLGKKSQILARLFRYSEAIACLDQAINFGDGHSNDPDFQAIAYWNKGCYYTCIDDGDENFQLACENLAQAIQIRPDYAADIETDNHLTEYSRLSELKSALIS